jgi:hypothetical protein
MNKISTGFIAAVITILLMIGMLYSSLFFLEPTYAQGPTSVQVRPLAAITDTPTITIAGATADTTPTPTTGAREAQIQWKFGTVSGSYSTCTVQAKTSFDGGTTFLTLGSAASVTVTSSTVNAWTLMEQLGTTSVTTSAVSSTAALGFGQLTKLTFACSSYGTSAPVTVSVTYR